ncbi:MAG: TIGR02921 family PEP-CTERM protein [Leptolyngbyaceae cyanobacterium T60_A2020_046]|nr:TIGR02921 family PEP-CTERM protein [Leptolyngbyaceae cyanobacterium T60_A2020_046]
MKTAIHALCQLLFWGWNLCFLTLVYLVMLPIAGLSIISGLAQGTIPLPFALPLVGLLVIPVGSVALGVARLRKHPVLLMRWFYGVEAPLLLGCVLRLFVLRELTPPSVLVLTVGAIAIVTLAVEICFGYAAYQKGLAWFQMASHSLVLVTGLYVGAVLLLYTVPVLCRALYALVSSGWWIGVWQYMVSAPLSAVFSLLVWLVLLGLTVSLFVAMPYAVVNLFTRSWGRILQAFGRQYGWWRGCLVTGAVVVGLSVAFAALYPQPQTWAFVQLGAVPTEVGARQALLARSPQIREGLLNAYLHPYRYLSPWNRANNLTAWYQTVFGLSREQAQQFQTLHNVLMSPFLYQGDADDVQKAADLYAEFFDVPIQRAETTAIVHALESTANRDSVEASVLNINQRIVYLAKQEVTVRPQGDWAEIEVYERYENPTRNDQEIFYQFSLPESAVITGLWLGERDLAQRYPFVVSPRGAAQQVYKAEIERSQQFAAEDPALLEQVGPRQYRLRVFPIPPRSSDREPGITHLWMTYRAMQQDGTWPLPQLAEKRNVFWTAATQRRRLGNLVTTVGDRWFEAALTATAAPPVAHTATIAEVQLTAQPVAAEDVALPQNQRFALVLDTSRSMGDRRTALAQTLTTAQSLAAQNTVEWIVTAYPGLAPQKLPAGQLPDLDAIAFYGHLSLAQQLQQFAQVRSPAPYHAILVITDQGTYELEPNAPDLPDLGAPLYFVHVDNTLPAAYEDTILAALTGTDGGVSGDLATALTRYASSQGEAGTVIDGYRWQMSAAAPAAATGDGFAPFAARQVIRWLARSQDVAQLAGLDQLHAIAKQYKVVTPYSSMLVLINDRQREALAAAEASADRFNRQVETGNDVLTNPNNPLEPASIPEPSGILGFLGASVLAWVVLRRYRI